MIWKALGVLILIAAGGRAQQANSDSQALQRRIAAIKVSIARNEAKLKRYRWTESTQISVKGKAKSIQQNECRYGPDGQLVKTPISGGPADKKLSEALDRIQSLIRRYVPPDPVAIQDAFQAGNAALDSDSGAVHFRDFAKPGDMLTLAFDPATRNIRSYEVTTFLDAPSDRVTLNAQFSTLPDGTNFLEEYELDARGKEIHIKTANFGHSQ